MYTKEEIWNSFSEDGLKEEIERFGSIHSKAIFILELLKTITGYKMQLFLYVKASGNEAVVTSNVWSGADPAPKQ
jgi:hypothetical protein